MLSKTYLPENRSTDVVAMEAYGRLALERSSIESQIRLCEKLMLCCIALNVLAAAVVLTIYFYK